MSSHFYEAGGQQGRLPLFGAVAVPQMRVLPAAVVRGCPDWRHACRLAWKLRASRHLSKRALAECAGLHYSHVTDYFSVCALRRELPAKYVGRVQAVLGNSVLSQWLAAQGCLTVMEELKLEMRRAG